MSQTLGPLMPPGTASRPSKVALHGRYTSVVPLELYHLESLYEEIGGPESEPLWTYMLSDKPNSVQQFKEMITEWSSCSDPFYYVVLSGPAADVSSKALGIMTFLNIVPDHRRIETGGIILGPRLKQTRMATEAFYLLMKHAFQGLGYLRYEWKANNLNKPSLAAASRLGFIFEGVFR